MACYDAGDLNRLLPVCACALTLLVAPGARAAVELGDGRTALSPETFALEDATGDLTIDDVRGPAAARFRPLAQDGENAGYTGSTYWLRVQVRNATTTRSSSFILELSATPAIAELYDDTGAVRRSGASLPFTARDVAYSNIAFGSQLEACSNESRGAC